MTEVFTTTYREGDLTYWPATVTAGCLKGPDGGCKAAEASGGGGAASSSSGSSNVAATSGSGPSDAAHLVMTMGLAISAAFMGVAMIVL